MVIETFEGRSVDPFCLEAGQVSVTEIAHVLAMLPRFGGHCRFHYSMAQSSLLASLLVPQAGVLPAVALLHDAPAAYLGAPVRPLAPLLRYEQGESLVSHYAAVRRCRREVLRALGLEPYPPGGGELEQVLLRVLWTERASLMPGKVPWVAAPAIPVRRGELPPKWEVLFRDETQLRELAPSQAEALFLERAAELGVAAGGAAEDAGT